MPPQARIGTESTAKKQKKKKGSITEEDISILQRRYPPTTVLSLLQEVANFPGSKIDWHALVKRTNTGITDAREYQMLWRHLAYCDTLLDKPELGAQPLDDDSDLEFELEASPAVSSDAATEIAQCVKVLIATGQPSNSNGANITTAETPLTNNIPYGCKLASDNIGESSSKLGTSMTHPVSVKAPPFEGLDGNDNMPPRKRRKAWSKAEDQELTAAVQKCGEGNWDDMLKGDFKGDRTAAQLLQRWNFLRKRDKNLNVGSVQSVKPQLTESQLATRRAITLALSTPQMMKSVGSKQNQTQVTQQPPLPNKVPLTLPSKVSAAAGGASSNLKPAAAAAAAAAAAVTLKTSPPRKANNMRPPPPDADTLGIQAAAVAAGARIATPSDAASLIAAAHSKKAVRIIPSGASSLIKSSSSLHSGPFHRISNGLPPPNSIARRPAPPLKAVAPPLLNTTTRGVSESTQVPLKQDDAVGGVKPSSTDQVQKQQVETISSKNDPTKAVVSRSTAQEEIKREVVAAEAREQGVTGNNSTSNLPSSLADKESSKMEVL